MIDLHAPVDDVALVRGPLVGEYHRIVAMDLKCLAMRLTMAVMGTWPFSAPFSFSLNNSGSRLRVTEISGKTARPGAVRDRLLGIYGQQDHWLLGRSEDLDADQGILAAAEQDCRASRQLNRGGSRAGSSACAVLWSILPIEACVPEIDLLETLTRLR